MADIGWLRHFGQRPKTPTMATDSATPDEQPEDASSPDQTSQHLPSPDKKSKAVKTSHHSPTRLHRAPGLRRVSSLLSVTSASELDRISSSLHTSAAGSLKSTHSDISLSSKAPPLKNAPIRNTPPNYEQVHFLDQDSDFAPSIYTGVPQEDDEAFFVREADRIWHAPSLDQMIEMLKVKLMTNPTDTLDRQYNGHVLALLEGYEKLKREVKETKEKAYSEALAAIQEEIDKYRLENEDYLKKVHEGYEEIKRLELFICHHTKEGVQNVLLVRSGSVIDRGARKMIEERYKRLSKDQSADGESEESKISPPTEAEGSQAEPKEGAPKHTRTISFKTGVDHERRLSKMLREEHKKHHSSRKKKAKRGEASGDLTEVPSTWAPPAPPSPGKGDSSPSPRRHGQPTAFGQQWGGTRMLDSSCSDDDSGASKGKDADRSGQDDNDDTIRFSMGTIGNGAADDEGGRPGSDSGWTISNFSSSDEDLLVMKKGAKRARQSRDAGAGRSSMAASQNPPVTESQYNTAGELPMERSLTSSHAAQEPTKDGEDRIPGARPLEGIEEDYFSQRRRRDERRRVSGFSFYGGDDDSFAVSPMAVQEPPRLGGGGRSTSTEPQKPTTPRDPTAQNAWDAEQLAQRLRARVFGPVSPIALPKPAYPNPGDNSTELETPAYSLNSLMAETVPAPGDLHEPQSSWSPPSRSDSPIHGPAYHTGGQTRGGGSDSDEPAKQDASSEDMKGKTSAARLSDEIQQPTPRSPWFPPTRKSGARQFQQAMGTDSPTNDVAPAVTTPLQAVGTLVTGTALATPSNDSDVQQSRPASTGSVVYHGNRLSNTGSRDSTGSVVTTVLRGNSGRSTGSRRQSSHTRATSSDQSFDSANQSASETPSPAMSPIPEGRRSRLDTRSPTPATRGRATNRSSQHSSNRGGRPPTTTTTPTSSTRSSPGIAPATTTTSDGTSTIPITPLHLPHSGIPTPPRRTQSTASAGGSEASGYSATTAGSGTTSSAAANAARIAAMLAVARNQKRRESEG